MQLKKFSSPSQKVLLDARHIAKKKNNQAVEPEHLFYALLDTAEVKTLIKKENLKYHDIRSDILSLIEKLPQTKEGNISFSARMIHALSSSYALSLSRGHKGVLVEDLLLALLENPKKYGALGALLSRLFLEEKENNTNVKIKDSNDKFLKKYTINLTSATAMGQIEPVFARDTECEKLIEILSSKSRNNPILVGEPGVGRTSIVHSLCKRIVQQKVPSHLIGKEILLLDIGLLIAGTTLRGQFEERIIKVIKELKESQGKYIIFIRDMGQLTGSNDASSGAVNFFKQALEAGEMQMIGIMTPESYKKSFDNDAAFKRFFKTIEVSSPDSYEAKKILWGVRENYEAFHGVFIEDDALEASIALSLKHMSGRVLPEVALAVLDEACAKKRIALEKRPVKLSLLEDKLFKEQIREESQKNKRQETLDVNSKKLKSLEEKVKAATKSYEEELTIIESMRAIKKEIARQKKLVKKKEEIHDIKDAAEISGVKLKDLQKEFKKRQNQLSKINKSLRMLDPFVKKEDVAQIISNETSIPTQKMLQSERQKLLQMEKMLSAVVVGQSHGIEAVSNAIRRARVGIKNAKKPIGSFLFLGPSGVGKTELARALTNFLFDEERALVRFDMSEFMEKHSVARLIGAPPGYQGSLEGGQLTECIRKKPYSVILFDEIEKAHRDVLNVLLQVFDEGHLSDSRGRMVQFNNTVLIMTSNIGADLLLSKTKDLSYEELKIKIMDRVLEHLRPELVNRIDEIIIFNTLSKNDMAKILNIKLLQLQKKLSEKGLELSIEENAKQKLVELGFDRNFGARPLVRVLQKHIENPLAMLLLKDSGEKRKKLNVYIDKRDAIAFELS